MSKIILIRHGRSAHVHAGWIDVHGFRRWREAYDAAGIAADDVPPPRVLELVRDAGLFVSSDVVRATESARALASGAQIVTSPLLRELSLPPPNLGKLRMPMIAWALAYGVRLLTNPHEHITPAERERAQRAAQWLTELAAQHETIAVMTHATFRSLLAKTLQTDGWSSDSNRGNAHWSAWTLQR
jgi:broad specificity phosphatase PhoE